MRPNETGAACDENSHSSEVQPRRTRSARRNFLKLYGSVYLPSRFRVLRDLHGESMTKLIALSAVAFALGLFATLWFRLWSELTWPKHVDPAFRIPSPLDLASLPNAARLDFPGALQLSPMQQEIRPI
jgi:hypothetical protein